MGNEIIQNIGNYKNLLTYQKAVIIYDITYYFCKNYMEKKDRTVDQMIQAARSGKQNIVEGCASGVKSLKSKIFLLNVAKASFLELLEDYKDYLMLRGHKQWEDNSVEKQKIRAIASNPDNDNLIIVIAKSRSPDVIANMMIVLLYQEDYLLYKFLQKLEE